MMTIETQRAAVRARLPKDAFCLGVLGDTTDYTPQLTTAVARAIAATASAAVVALVTGGTPGVPAHFSEVFPQSRVFHVLPVQCRLLPSAGAASGSEATTLYAGADMPERRAIFGAICDCYVAMGGGPGASDELRHAVAAGRAVIPVASSGGAAMDAACSSQHQQRFPEWRTPLVGRPAAVDPEDWKTITDQHATLSDAAAAVERAVSAIVGSSC